jgi:GTP-binding protein
MADIPGIIEGAAEGKGLGLRFLRHIERNSLLLFMVPAESDDIRKEYELLLRELEKFNPDMLQKHRVLAVTKCDILDEELLTMLKEELENLTSLPVVFISSVTGFGIEDLKDLLWQELNSESNKIQGVIAEETLVHRDRDIADFADLEDIPDDEEETQNDDDEMYDAEDLEDFEYV